MPSWSDFTPDFVVWKLTPTGCKLTTKELAPGVYALLSSIPGADNVGFVVGKKGVLVIDAHISVAMARQIQERIREVTDKPILYLVNSNYHADHVFGNCAFPRETVLIQHRETAARTPYFKEEWEFMLPAVANDPKIFEGASSPPARPPKGGGGFPPPPPGRPPPRSAGAPPAAPPTSSSTATSPSTWGASP